VDERLRVQSAGGAIYLRANAPIESARLQLQDAETGALMLVDVTAVPATPGAAPLEPVRIIDATRQAERDEEDRRDCGKSAPCAADFMQAAPGTPVPVVLTRYAAQSLYAPLRTIEEVAGIVPVALPRNLTLETLLPGLAIRAKALAAWRLADHWVTAVRLTHTAQGWLTLDPRTLQGDFVAATFQHPTLGPAGESTDTTVVYIVTRGHGLAEALLPAISPIDASNNVSPSSLRDGGHDEE
jgi:integrating conjugative element protein (TIGR03749 family)